MEIQRGQRFKIKDYIDINKVFNLKFTISGVSVYDVSCFGLDSNIKLSNEDYMIFYNHMYSSEHAILMEQNGYTKFSVNLFKLPAYIKQLSFTISIDGQGKMSEIDFCKVQLLQDNKEIAVLNLSGNDFKNEKAIISIEIYYKDEWRFNAVARGFDGGLSELLKLYGGEEAQPEDSVIEAEIECNKVSLEKKLQVEAPKLVNLAKPIMFTLEKKKLNNVVAKVGLVLDISGSMSARYRNGTVQMIVNKTVPLAVQFDDNGELDLWFYGSHAKRMAPVTLENYETTIPYDYNNLMKSLGACNYEPEVMRMLIEEYKNSNIPAYIIFITDGGVGAKREIKKLLIEASDYPMFWQFVGIGGYGYGILKELDTLSRRTVDNANFFSLDDFRTVPNEELYDRLLNEFPIWLQSAKNAGIFS